MLDRRPRGTSGEGMTTTLGRRLRLLRRRTTRWFQPPVRSGVDAASSTPGQTSFPVLSRGTKRPEPLH
jgi:hypothetical protein